MFSHECKKHGVWTPKRTEAMRELLKKTPTVKIDPKFVIPIQKAIEENK